MTQDELNYTEARNDVLKAAKSLNKLTPLQSSQLFRELFGAEAVVAMYNIMRQYFG